MPEYQIFSDGACDLDRKIAANLNIKILPFYISLNNETYLKEIDELSLDNFYKGIIEDKIFPKTSLPSVQDYVDAFSVSLKEGKDVLCFTITDTLSGSFQSASTAKLIAEEQYPNSKIYVINSWLATGAQTLLLMEATRMKQNGMSIEEVFKTCEKLKETARIIFMVGGLQYLEKGGRIGKLASLSGSILNIKPLIELKNSEINVAGISRGRKKGLLKLSELTKKHFISNNENIEDYYFTIGTTNTWDEVPGFHKILSNDIKNAYFIEPFNIGATIAAHTGPDTVGVCFIKKYEKL